MGSGATKQTSGDLTQVLPTLPDCQDGYNGNDKVSPEETEESTDQNNNEKTNITTSVEESGESGQSQTYMKEQNVSINNASQKMAQTHQKSPQIKVSTETSDNEGASKDTLLDKETSSDLTTNDKSCAKPQTKTDTEEDKPVRRMSVILTRTNVHSLPGTSRGKARTRAPRITWDDSDNDALPKQSKPQQVVRKKAETLTRKQPGFIKPKNGISGSKGKGVLKFNRDIAQGTGNIKFAKEQTNSKINTINSKVCFRCQLRSHVQEDKLMGVTWHKCSICVRWWHDYCLPEDLVRGHNKPTSRRTLPRFRCPACPLKPVCSVCLVTIPSTEKTATCDYCLLHFHLQCLPSDHQSHFKVLSKLRKNWHCGRCVIVIT